MTESDEASPDAGSHLDAIIAELDAPFGVLPEKAIKAARLHKEAMIPRLIALIEDATRAIDLNGSLAAAWKQMAAKGVKRIQSSDIV